MGLLPLMILFILILSAYFNSFFLFSVSKEKDFYFFFSLTPYLISKSKLSTFYLVSLYLIRITLSLICSFVHHFTLVQALLDKYPRSFIAIKPLILYSCISALCCMVSLGLYRVIGPILMDQICEFGIKPLMVSIGFFNHFAIGVIYTFEQLTKDLKMHTSTSFSPTLFKLFMIPATFSFGFFLVTYFVTLFKQDWNWKHIFLILILLVLVSPLLKPLCNRQQSYLKELERLCIPQVLTNNTFVLQSLINLNQVGA